MKLTVEESIETKDVEITIKCGIVDEQLEQLISIIRQYTFSMSGRKDGREYNVSLQNIYYFESIDDKTFIYTKDDMFECDIKLYELEKLSADLRFVRISKSCVLNIKCIESIKALFNGKYEAALSNGENIIVNRHYVREFKEKFLGRR